MENFAPHRAAGPKAKKKLITVCFVDLMKENSSGWYPVKLFLPPFSLEKKEGGLTSGARHDRIGAV